MNPEAQAEFDRIVAIAPEGLTDADKDFLRARRDYLNKEQLDTFADVLKNSSAAQNTNAEASEEAPSARKIKKASEEA